MALRCMFCFNPELVITPATPYEDDLGVWHPEVHSCPVCKTVVARTLVVTPHETGVGATLGAQPPDWRT